MNVLSDILCDSGPLMVPENYNSSLLSHDKMLPSHNTIVTSKKRSMHLLDSLSNISDSMGRPINALNNSSPSNIDIFSVSDQVHLSTSLESTNFHDGSTFASNSFQEIVPPWLTHDFMKVSDDLTPIEILPNVSVAYPCVSENENLEMLDLGFSSELASQDLGAGTLNRSHMDNGQKLLTEESMQRYSTADSLLSSSFNNINNSHLQMPLTKNSTLYQKFKHNSPQSIMNAALPCENELLNIPLPSSIADECLTNSSSPSMLPRNQSQTHPVDIVCDKLPQINLNHLDTLLGNESTLPTIQLLRHDFSNVRMSEEVECSPLNPTHCNPNRNNICSANYQNNTITSHTQDISVQVSESALQQSLLKNVKDCSSCISVPLESTIEITQCFKCKFCSFVSLHKCSVANHVNLSHSKSSSESNSTGSGEDSSMTKQSDQVSFIPLNVGGRNGSCISKSDSVILGVNNHNLPMANECNSLTPICSEIGYRNMLIKVINNQFLCDNCDKAFSDLNECKSHLASYHRMKFDNLYLKMSKHNKSAISSNNVKTSANESFNKSASSISSKNTKIKPILPKRKNPLERDDEMEKIDQNENKKIKNGESNLPEKKISSHKEAWRKKLKRELGSYICEFKGCNVRFRALDNLEYHRKCHVSGGNTFACPECEMKFENWPVIAGHLWRIHSNDMELHACDQCPFRTYSLGRLENIHKRIHQNECEFLCDTCGKSFKSSKQLRNHRVIHLAANVEKKQHHSIKCSVCPAQFSSKKLQQHHYNNVHNRQKPNHVCSYCDYTTANNSTMKMHMRQHTGEKPFSCDKCNYRTSDHNSLRRHKMTHSGEKPYKCPYCSYGSIQASTYKDHLKNQHPDKNQGLMFCCNQCSFRTIKQDTYLEHIMEHEQLNTPPETAANSLHQHNDDAEMFSLVEAMDISLSHGDNTFLSHLNKINIQSYLRNLNINMTAVYNDGVM